MGGLYAGAVGFVLNFLVFPQANSYATLMLALMPCVFVAGLAMTHPRYGLIGRGFLVTLALLIRPANDGLEPFGEFASSFIGNELGVAIAILCFLLIPPLKAKTLLRARMSGVFSDLVRGFGMRRDVFETRLYDRLLALPGHSGDAHDRRDARRAGFALLTTGLNGQELLLLAERAGFTSDLNEEIAAGLGKLQHAFAHEGTTHAASVEELRSALEHLARRMYQQAHAFQRPVQRGYGIRAAVAAELMAIGLEHYHETWGATRLVTPQPAA